MTKFIKRCERDGASLSRLSGAPRSTPPQPQTYRDRVVIKPWGYEFLMFENEHVAAWVLHIGKDQSTSMHCHPRKKTSLMALAGKALFNTFLRRHYLNAVDAMIIQDGVFHSTKCLSPEGLYLIEVETPPDKTDLVRLSDDYQRQSQGYEGLSEMKTENLDRYGWFYFDEPAPDQSRQVSFQNTGVSIFSYPDGAHFAANFRPSIGDFYCSLRGRIFDPEGNVVLDVGDVHDGEFLESFRELSIAEPVVVLSVSSVQQ
jgi:hypothetical protein